MGESIGLSIDKGLAGVREAKSRKDYMSDDEYIMRLLEELLPAYRYEIHDYLSGIKTKESEMEIRKRVREILTDFLPVVDAKGRKVMKYIDYSKGFGLGKVPEKMRPYAKRWLKVRDGYYALAAFRSLKHFFLYMEESRECVDRPIWSPAPACLFGGYWHYANRKILDDDISFMLKQMPTGYGKTASDAFEIAFIFGYDINSDVIKVFGNPSNISPGFSFITSLMQSERYSEVFPYYAQFRDKGKTDIYETCKYSDGEFKIRGSTKARNLLMFSKEKKVSGARAKYLYIDDITQMEDASNVRMHDSDISQFNNVWFKRNYDLTDFKITASGTTYSEYDILSYLRKRAGGEEAEKTQFKYTTESRSDIVRANGLAVFIRIPKLDYDTDVSTYPSKYPTEKARKDRALDEDMFLAMDQQLPPPPEGTPFSNKLIKTYDCIKHEDRPLILAALDPSRTGKNYVAMCICEKIGSHHYLKDVIYELKPMQKVHLLIVEKIISHGINRLHIENNTDTSLKTLLDGMLKDRGVTDCIITEVYSTKQKVDKIYATEAAVKENMWFPNKEMYASSSPMGKFMKEFTGYSYTRKNDFDDATDVISQYAEKYIIEPTRANAVQYLYRTKGGHYNVR